MSMEQQQTVKKMKICSKCGIEKPITEFHKNKIGKYGVRGNCKECVKLYKKQYNEDNKERIKQYYENNKEHYKQYYKQYYENKAKYETYAHRIEYAEEVREDIEGYLLVRCAYCDCWIYPTNREVMDRISALEGSCRGECRIYCSSKCKKACPTFNQTFYSKDQVKHRTVGTSREVQAPLRKMVLERDNWICQECGRHKDELDVALHCHHMKPVSIEPFESADMDVCTTLCKTCHKKEHKKPGMRYSDLKKISMCIRNGNRDIVESFNKKKVA